MAKEDWASEGREESAILETRLVAIGKPPRALAAMTAVLGLEYESWRGAVHFSAGPSAMNSPTASVTSAFISASGKSVTSWGIALIIVSQGLPVWLSVVQGVPPLERHPGEGRN